MQLSGTAADVFSFSSLLPFNLTRLAAGTLLQACKLEGGLCDRSSRDRQCID